MIKKVVVLSLGGSLIIPDKVDHKFLEKFKKVILKNCKDYKFIIVCGGGSIARKYIHALQSQKLSHDFQSLGGISATRMNARFMDYFFKINPEKGIPQTLRRVKQDIKKRDILFCGALEYKPEQTSDSTTANLAKVFKTDFINITNVPGLHDKNPKKFKNAKFISKITWKEFIKMANKTKFTPGQHFVLDQTAAKMIEKNKTTTYIIGQNPKELDHLLNNKKFKGTTIQN